MNDDQGELSKPTVIPTVTPIHTDFKSYSGVPSVHSRVYLFGYYRYDTPVIIFRILLASTHKLIDLGHSSADPEQNKATDIGSPKAN